MPFLDTNSHMTTEPDNFDIKYQFNSENYDRHSSFGTKIRVVRVFDLQWKVFSTKENTLGMTGWRKVKNKFTKKQSEFFF